MDIVERLRRSAAGTGGSTPSERALHGEAADLIESLMKSGQRIPGFITQPTSAYSTPPGVTVVVTKTASQTLTCPTCGYEWYAVYPEGTTEVECPACGCMVPT